jgi:hypothetical protein
MKPKIQPLANLLNDKLRKLNEQASLLAQAAALYAEVLPSRLRVNYQIAGINANTIVITTTSPQARYALTQFSHDFIRKLQKLKSFAQISKVNIKIDLQLEQIKANSQKSVGGHLAKAKRPSKQVALLMNKISEGIADPELAAALSKLAKLGH